MKNKKIQRDRDEAKVYEKQVANLQDKLKEKSDTETYEDEDEMKKNEEKAREVEKLKDRVADIQQLIEEKEKENEEKIQEIKSKLSF